LKTPRDRIPPGAQVEVVLGTAQPFRYKESFALIGWP
jgi:hypothetical protein